MFGQFFILQTALKFAANEIIFQDMYKYYRFRIPDQVNSLYYKLL